jgi:hypothetical protein
VEDTQMIEAIQVAGMDPAQAAMPGNAMNGGAQAHATPIDVRDFGVAMERTASAPPAAPPVQAAPSEGTRAVIAALNNLNSGAENINALSQSMSGNIAELTPGQMMEMTMKCHQFLFQTELTSNVANRTSDGIQQLFRQQS